MEKKDRYDYYRRRYEECRKEYREHRHRASDRIGDILSTSFILTMGGTGIIVAAPTAWAMSIIYQKLDFRIPLYLGMLVIGGSIVLGPTILTATGYCAVDFIRSKKYEAKTEYYKLRAKLARPIDEGGLETEVR